ncbi:MAG: hypothetical protein K6C40_06080 [Thermoguttaceae bacterium]|nr:hypothetical protein [Thermoguttaceae bacterium]
MISLTFAALLAVTSYSLAEEFADMTEELDAELTAVIENMAEPENSQAENVQPNVPVASQAAMPQRNQRAPQPPMQPQVKRAPQPPMQPQAQRAQKVQKAPTAQKTQNQRALTRKEIRSMDILDRPNRPGHFYGNTVRRRHGR